MHLTLSTKILRSQHLFSPAVKRLVVANIKPHSFTVITLTNTLTCGKQERLNYVFWSLLIRQWYHLYSTYSFKFEWVFLCWKAYFLLVQLCLGPFFNKGLPNLCACNYVNSWFGFVSTLKPLILLQAAWHLDYFDYLVILFTCKT